MALSFNGTTSQIVGSTSSAFNFENTTFSIALRFNYTLGTPGSGQTPISKGGYSSGNANLEKGWAVLLNGFADGKVRIFTKTGNGTGGLSADVYTSNSNYNDTGWHHVVFQVTTSTTVAATNTASIFIDGAYEFVAGASNGTNVYGGGSTQPLALGVRCPGSAIPNPLNGKLADVGLWSVGLTDAEKAAYCKGMTAESIRPQSLVFCPPCVREVIDLKGMSLTPTNISVTTHPRVYG